MKSVRPGSSVSKTTSSGQRRLPKRVVRVPKLNFGPSQPDDREVCLAAFCQHTRRWRYDWGHAVGFGFLDSSAVTLFQDPEAGLFGNPMTANNGGCNYHGSFLREHDRFSARTIVKCCSLCKRISAGGTDVLGARHGLHWYLLQCPVLRPKAHGSFPKALFMGGATSGRLPLI